MEKRKPFTAKEAKEIGEKLGIKWDKFDVEQFRAGLDVELECYQRQYFDDRQNRPRAPQRIS